MIRRALLNCRLILPPPAPVIAIQTINAAFAEFEITFFTETLASSRRAQNEWFDLVDRHLAAAAIDPASPESTPTPVSGAAQQAQSQTDGYSTGSTFSTR